MLDSHWQLKSFLKSDWLSLRQACHLDILMKTQGEKKMKLKSKKTKTHGFSQNTKNPVVPGFWALGLSTA